MMKKIVEILKAMSPKRARQELEGTKVSVLILLVSELGVPTRSRSSETLIDNIMSMLHKQ